MQIIINDFENPHTLKAIIKILQQLIEDINNRVAEREAREKEYINALQSNPGIVGVGVCGGQQFTKPHLNY